MAETTAIDILTQPFPPEDPADLPGILETFAEHYSGADILAGPAPAGPDAVDRRKRVPLNAALAMEAMFCEADPDRRQDPLTRIQWIAGNLAAAGSLQPEHSHFLATR